MGKIRGTHSSPGHYTKITDLEYAAKTMGLTSLGLVGETEKGPAFEDVLIADKEQFAVRFGGTSTEKFKDSQYPKYELPYIANEYLKASDKLHVCRVLGLSGYRAGKAFVITASKGADKYVVAVLRSRGSYKKYGDDGSCNTTSTYDQLNFVCDTVDITNYTELKANFNCDTSTIGGTPLPLTINALNLGKFAIVTNSGETNERVYNVSLNPGDKDYIYKVLGGKANDGDAPVFVEELYDIMLANLVQTGKVEKIDSSVITKDELGLTLVSEPVDDFLTIPEKDLTRKNLGLTYIYAGELAEDITDTGFTEGQIYKVVTFTDENGVMSYVYEAIDGAQVDETKGVKVISIDSYVYIVNEKVSVASDFSDYHESYRCAVTPWIVSELKGGVNQIELKKLFRFYTISDGNAANSEIKISIANIMPDEGTFDVYIRDYNDSDSNPTILESYRNLTMVPGDPRYIGLKIGTVDGEYESKSSYVLVEVIENDMTAECVPAGFLGYPIRNYGSAVKAPIFKYNTIYDTEIKDRRQYFGLSDLTGVDVDMLNYKGKNAYTETYKNGYTPAFHLDATLNENILPAISGFSWDNVSVDGITGIEWETVSPANRLNGSSLIPVISNEANMANTIYENVKLRKFTVYPYGGFDGWDIYRNSRTNTDDFKANKYKGAVGISINDNFSKIISSDTLNLTGNCITSDYYAYLAGIMLFQNPEMTEINLLATPGIDYVNNQYLVEDAIDMVDARQDCFYVPTTPDKPWGASDDIEDMFTSSEAAANLEDTRINTYYASTYYPWVKFYDDYNYKYINLPATKDVVRNMADTDNKRYPWIAPAGLERGKINAKNLHSVIKLEDRDNTYDARINPLIKFSKEGIKVWGNKTMYDALETNPMTRINAVRLVLYMRKVLIESTLFMIFDPEDDMQKEDFERVVNDVLSSIKDDRGITDYRLKVEQTDEQRDAHEMSGTVFVKPTPDLEYIELNFVVTPQGIKFDDIVL